MLSGADFVGRPSLATCERSRTSEEHILESGVEKRERGDRAAAAATNLPRTGNSKRRIRAMNGHIGARGRPRGQPRQECRHWPRASGKKRFAYLLIRRLQIASLYMRHRTTSIYSKVKEGLWQRDGNFIAEENLVFCASQP
jgi:hypothetical protein